ncbi:hypothetical protein EV667_2177 [Ancylobacter aquaticus]|uniref:Uncharacterized protein n=2 Tax=Ancylobacter aquaticus TaxID=100 RepID=A0A4R1I699_ANCAQ|nr:hypothetical protein EV667_2177 [Ancylobacter aquaticus]
MDYVRAEHSCGMVRLCRNDLDPAGGKPQAIILATLNVAQARELSVLLQHCAAYAADYKECNEQEEIGRLEAEIKVRQDKLAKLRGRP